MAQYEEIVGLVPAAGLSTRLSPLPCSNELFPIWWILDEKGKISPKVASHFLLDQYKAAGIRKTYFIVRKGKWDIPQYYGDGEIVDMNLAYLIMNLPHGHPFTLDQAFPFTTHNLVAFGYPDILLEPADAFCHLISRQAETKASVVLGVFPIRPDQRWNDILSFGDDRKIQTIALEDPNTASQRWGWSIALWTPDFSHFMHEFLVHAVKQNRLTGPGGKEYVMNHVLQAALDQGLSMESVVFDSGSVLDIGMPTDLHAAQSEQLRQFDKIRNGEKSIS
jgi:glucose-1-phosphate thymidylyltransferase